MELFDFDKSMAEYAKNWYSKNAKKFKEDELQDKALEAVEKWKKTPIPELNNQTPEEYFNSCEDKLLIPLLEAYISIHNVPSLLLDELAKRNKLENDMVEIIKKREAGELTETLMNILLEMECKAVIPIYAEWLFDTEIDEHLGLLASEILHEIIDKPTFDKIDQKLPSVPEKLKPRLSDFVVYTPSTENGYKLLLDLFLTASEEDKPLYASYLGMYGNPKAIPHLKMASEDCGYVAYIEIVNAVERLGGDIDTIRSFEDDPDYRIIKTKS